jgi:LAS superfamily LD-carboxypeptidase LdcB
MLNLSGLNPEVAGRVRTALERARAAGLSVTIVSTYRSIREQQRLYDAWLARGRRGLPAAVPGRSTHNYGYAVDVAVAGGQLQRFVRIAECAGLKWAGARDPVHFDVFGFEAWNRVLAGQPYTVRYEC